MSQHVTLRGGEDETADTSLTMGQNGYTITREGESTMHCTTLGIDVAKSVFHLRGSDERGEVVL
jgi:hypothetical protein